MEWENFHSLLSVLLQKQCCALVVFFVSFYKLAVFTTPNASIAHMQYPRSIYNFGFWKQFIAGGNKVYGFTHPNVVIFFLSLSVYVCLFVSLCHSQFQNAKQECKQLANQDHFYLDGIFAQETGFFLCVLPPLMPPPPNLSVPLIFLLSLLHFLLVDAQIVSHIYSCKWYATNKKNNSKRKCALSPRAS